MLSYKTAIKRTKLSAPAATVKELGFLKGRVLDYGCGRGKDCEILGIEGYDPYWSPKLPSGKFDTILCTFVLNTVSKAEQEIILSDIQTILSNEGKAYITVRRDIKQEGVTSKNTFQRNVVLDLPLLICKKDRFAIYVMEKV